MLHIGKIKSTTPRELLISTQTFLLFVCSGAHFQLVPIQLLEVLSSSLKVTTTKMSVKCDVVLNRLLVDGS